MQKRIEKELIQLRKDVDLTRQCHAEMYEFIEESQIEAMDNWEDVLFNDLYEIEERVEVFLQTLCAPTVVKAMSIVPKQTNKKVDISGNFQAEVRNVDADNSKASDSSLPQVSGNQVLDHSGQIASTSSNQTANADAELIETQVPTEARVSTEAQVSTEVRRTNQAAPPESNYYWLGASAPSSKAKPTLNLLPTSLFDNWIDQLIEFEETAPAVKTGQMSIAKALCTN